MKRKLTIGIAPDSFKGTLTARQAAEAIACGFKTVWPNATCRLIPMADGGEGFSAAVVDALGGSWKRVSVRDPLGRKIFTRFGWIEQERLAVIEMAAASGLLLLQPAERNPLITTTSGTGDLLQRALDLGARSILLGIGGSATTDGGVGMAQAMGWRFLDKAGNELQPGGADLLKLASIDSSGVDARLKNVEITVACDVDNPLSGTKGAAFVYAPQKGADAAAVRKLDAGLRQLVKITKKTIGSDFARIPGAGAAGGLGFGLMAFCGARVKKGVECVAEAVHLAECLQGCDLVITGEGRIDDQTIHGKTPVGVAAVARRLGIPVIAFCGITGKGYHAVHQHGIAAVIATGGDPHASDFVSGAASRLQKCVAETARAMDVVRLLLV